MKDPAFLFYSSDFLTGTMTMEDDQVGKYIRLLCLQHQKRRLTKKDMLKICETYDKDIFEKFNQDENGYFNQRLDEEIERRIKYSESRRKNREGKNNICKSYVPHMETETENIDINSINKEEISEKEFEVIRITKALHTKLRKKAPDDYDIKHAKWGDWIKKVRPFVKDRDYTFKQFQKIWEFIDNDKFWDKTIITLDSFLNNFEKIKTQYVRRTG